MYLGRRLWSVFSVFCWFDCQFEQCLSASAWRRGSQIFVLQLDVAVTYHGVQIPHATHERNISIYISSYQVPLGDFKLKSQYLNAPSRFWSGRIRLSELCFINSRIHDYEEANVKGYSLTLRRKCTGKMSLWMTAERYDKQRWARDDPIRLFLNPWLNTAEGIQI